MRVRFRGIPNTALPAEALYLAPTQTFFAERAEYDVHAVSVYEGFVFLLVVDDRGTPMFRIRSLFDLVDTRVPEDWICNVFPTGPVQMVLGPPFVAKDLDAYSGMVDQRWEQQSLLWKRIEDARPKDVVDDED